MEWMFLEVVNRFLLHKVPLFPMWGKKKWKNTPSSDYDFEESGICAFALYMFVHIFLRCYHSHQKMLIKTVLTSTWEHHLRWSGSWEGLEIVVNIFT